MVKLPKKTKYLRVRRFRLVATPALIAKHARNLEVENQLHNYAVRYLEKAYGRKHLERPLPTTKIGKATLINDEIIPRFAHDVYHHEGRWNGKKLGLHSQAAQEFLVTLITNFGEYRKVLKKAAKMTDEEKVAYRDNRDRNNPQHRSWYRKGSLSYLRNGASHKTVSLPDNGQIEVLSPHWIKIQDYGEIQVVENIKHLATARLVTSKIKRKDDGTYELQLVLKNEVERKPPRTMIGADWNMKDNKVFHTSDDEKVYLNYLELPDKRLVDVNVKADQYETTINKLKRCRSIKEKHLSADSKQLADLSKQIRYYSARRANLLTERYRQIAWQMFAKYDLIAIEELDAKEMRKENQAWSEAANRGKNRKLAKVKPYEIALLLKQVADREGKTLLKVDSYKTSQVEFGKQYQEKHHPSERQWVSKYTGKLIDRDLNASCNILTWALDPKKHIKYLERQAAIKAAKKAGIAKDKLPKAIPARSLVTVN